MTSSLLPSLRPDRRRFGFAVRAVYSRGELVARDGEPVGRPGRGRLVRPLR